MNQELVSAVIPTFNYGRYVTEAVDSALAQTHRNLEIIVVDDGSTDDTRERLAGYRDRIIYVFQKNQGLSAARNTGIRHARGEWIALLDSDDVWHPQKTDIQLRAAKRFTGVGLIGSPSASIMWPEVETEAAARLLSQRDFLLSGRIGPSGALIYRSCFDRVGLFDTALRSCEDRDMWLRLSVEYPAMLVLSPCWWYRRHSTQMSRRATPMYLNHLAVLEKFFRRHGELCHLQSLGEAYMYLDASWCYFEEGDRRRAIAYLLRSFARRPLGIHDELSKPFHRCKALTRFVLGDRVFQGINRFR